MKLESQVCSLSLSKELKSAGYKQEGLWWWIWNTHLDKTEGLRFYKNTMAYLLGGKIEDGGIIRYYAAPTVAELGERLPSFLKEKGTVNDLIIWKREGDWRIDYGYRMRIDKHFANALAKMYLYLKKENLI